MWLLWLVALWHLLYATVLALYNFKVSFLGYFDDVNANRCVHCAVLYFIIWNLVPSCDFFCIFRLGFYF